MTARSTTPRIAAAAALVLTGLAACNRSETAPLAVPVDGTAALHGAHPDASYGPDVSRWLAGLRQATAKFQDIDVAAAAGWDVRITECMELTGTGGMGYHYGNTGLIDGVAQEYAPELLVYEPQKNGRLRLVAVEYIVPYSEQSAEGPAPSLHGIDFHRNDTFGLWVLHAWVWKHNPAGIFADWNPDVSCAFAPQP